MILCYGCWRHELPRHGLPPDPGRSGGGGASNGRGCPWWLRPLGDMTEIAQPDPTYIQKVERVYGDHFTTASTIDRCFLTLPPGVMVHLRTTGAAADAELGGYQRPHHGELPDLRTPTATTT